MSVPIATQAHTNPPLSDYICFFRQTEKWNPRVNGESLGISEICVVCAQGEWHVETNELSGLRMAYLPPLLALPGVDTRSGKSVLSLSLTP